MSSHGRSPVASASSPTEIEPPYATVDSSSSIAVSTSPSATSPASTAGSSAGSSAGASASSDGVSAGALSSSPPQAPAIRPAIARKATERYRPLRLITVSPI